MYTKKFQIEERRRQVASYLAQSMTELEIADKLGVTRVTISRDIKVLKEMSQQFIYDLAKSDLAYYYKQCIDAIQEAERIIWESYRNKDQFTEPERKERYQLAKIIIDSVQACFSLFKDGPSIMAVKSMEERLEYLESRYGNQEFRKEALA
jgi:IS30 family transposase